MADRQRSAPASDQAELAERTAAAVRPVTELDEATIRLLLIGFRISERHLLARAAHHGFGDIRMTHFPILRGMSRGAERITDIADMAKITKQTAGVLAAELEQMGYIGRFPDRQDRRAKVVRFTARGRALMAILPRIMGETEDRIVDSIGPNDLNELMRILIKLAANSGETPSVIAP